ncbi:MAG: APC family permease [Alphaproteobacteria bacterium]
MPRDNPDSPPSHRAQPALRRRLGLFLLSCYGAGTIIGAGIYVLVGAVIAAAGDAAPLAFLIAGALAALTGLSYAELSARFPEAAGAAAYVAQGLRSPRLAQAVGAAAALVAAVAAASIARGSAGYLAEFLPLPSWLLAACVVTLFTAIACLDVRESVGLAALVTLVEVAGLLLVILAGAHHLDALPARAATLVPDSAAGLAGLAAGAFLAFFAYSGFETIVNMAEETRDPARTMPHAILIALAVAGVLYIAVVTIVLLALPPERLAAGDTPLALVVADSGWFPSRILSAIAVIATTNGVLVEILMVSRLLYGMARRGWAPGFLAAVAPRTHTPVRATLVAGVGAGILAAVVPIETLASATSALFLLVFGFVNLALWRLHRRAGHRGHKGFRAPRWVPPVGCVLSFALILALFAA